LGLQTTVTLEVVAFRAYAPFPALLPFLYCILEVVFCEDVQHRLILCFDHLSCVKMAVFQFYFHSGKQIKVGWVVNDSLIVFGKEFPAEK
jgi:hypothetical protein